MVFRIYYQNQVTHMHCLLYVAAASDRTFALAGSFTIKPEELDEFQKQCPKIQFLNGSGKPLRPPVDSLKSP